MHEVSGGNLINMEREIALDFEIKYHDAEWNLLAKIMWKKKLPWPLSLGKTIKGMTGFHNSNHYTKKKKM